MVSPRELTSARRWLRRYARFLGQSGPLPAAELDALADLGLSLALPRFSRSLGLALSTYARRWVLGAVRRAELAERRAVGTGAAFTPSGLSAAPMVESRLRARELLSGLPPEEAEVLWCHAALGEALAAIGRRRGRSRLWARRAYQRALRRARAARGDEAS